MYTPVSLIIRVCRAAWFLVPSLQERRAQDESSSLSRWVCEVNDSWRSVEKLEKSEKLG